MITQREFVIDGAPKGQGRPRWGNGRMYKAAADRAWEDKICSAYSGSYPDAKPYEHAVSVHVECYLPIPRSDSKAKREAKLSCQTPATVKPDLDNVLKSVLDALNGCAWHDDRQIDYVWGSKMYSDNPRLKVMLRGKEEAP